MVTVGIAANAAQDAAGNNNTAATQLNRTYDSTAPTLTAGTVSRTSDADATVKFSSNETGTYYYSVVDDEASAPTIDTAGAGTACSTSETTITLSTLTAGA